MVVKMFKRKKPNEPRWLDAADILAVVRSVRGLGGCGNNNDGGVSCCGLEEIFVGKEKVGAQERI